jgi:hypothetical protein
MRSVPGRSPGEDGPAPTTPQLAQARTDFLGARHELCVAALNELLVRVRATYPQAAQLELSCDDIEDEIYIAAVTDARGRPLSTCAPLLQARTTEQVLANLHGPSLAALPHIRHDPATMTFTAALPADAPNA